MHRILYQEANMRYARVLFPAALALAVALPAAMPAPADAAPGVVRKDVNRGEAMYGRMQERLGLTDDQVKAIREIHAGQSEARKQVFTALRQAQADLRQLALSGAGEDAVQAKRAEIEKLTSQMVDLRVKALQAMAPILTPEQREKLSQSRGHGGHRGPRQS
jgi:Spy/CpxP family protein refolding chaperone